MWEQLPNDIIWKILYMADLPIDTRIALRMKPKKLDADIGRYLWFLLHRHDGFMYNIWSKSLHIFQKGGFHIIRRPVTIDFYSQFTLLNEEGKEHTVEVISPCGCFCSSVSDETYITTKRIMLA